MKFFASIREALPYLRSADRTGASVGSVHTLGALHEGHGRLIKRAADENDVVIVTVYPNKIQLFPGSIYQYSIDEDCSLAAKFGATYVIASSDEEMFPPGYCTFIDQGSAHLRLNSSVFSFATRGQVTGAVRWMILTQPTNSYYGMKDIEQALMVQRAAKDLFLPTKIQLVPCIRHPDGVPISSRLRKLTGSARAQLASVYRALDLTRTAIAGGIDASVAQSLMLEALVSQMPEFRILYCTVVDIENFAPITGPISVPFILHVAVQNDDVTHFDGLCILTDVDLRSGPETIWLDS